MKIAIIIVLCVILLLIVFVLWRHHATVKGGQELGMALMSEVGPLVSAIESGQQYSSDTLTSLAKRRDTRSVLFRTLHEVKKSGLFPKEYGALWQIAESDLTAWLMHPNELGAVPDEMILAKEIERSEGEPPQRYRFFIFKFRTLPPHWAADKGWTAGIAGPYWDGELPLTSPPGVFSRFESFDSATPEEHLQKTEDLVLKVIK